MRKIHIGKKIQGKYVESLVVSSHPLMSVVYVKGLDDELLGKWLLGDCPEVLRKIIHKKIKR